MTERAISGMQIPASTAGRQAAATTRTAPKKLHPGVVQSVSGSRAMVLIGTEVEAAQISPTALEAMRRMLKLADNELGRVVLKDALKNEIMTALVPYCEHYVDGSDRILSAFHNSINRPSI